MKETYLNLSEDDLKGKARNIWIKTKPLTLEEKEELKSLRERIIKMEKENIETMKIICKIMNKIKRKERFEVVNINK